MKLLYLILAFFPSLSFAEPLPKQWLVMTNGVYETGIEKESSKGNVAFIRSGNVKNDNYSIVTQTISCGSYKENVKVSADLRTNDVRSRAGLFVKVDGSNSVWIDNFKSRPIMGTTDWSSYVSIVPIPENCKQLTFGFILEGSGSVWADNFNVTSSSENPTTDYRVPARIDKPENLNFDNGHQQDI